MFGMSIWEIAVILAIALIIIGPQKLPDLAKSLGRALGEFKRATSDFKESIRVDSEIRDVRESFNDIRQETKEIIDISADSNKLPVDNTSSGEKQPEKTAPENAPMEDRTDPDSARADAEVKKEAPKKT